MLMSFIFIFKVTLLEFHCFYCNVKTIGPSIINAIWQKNISSQITAKLSMFLTLLLRSNFQNFSVLVLSIMYISLKVVYLFFQQIMVVGMTKWFGTIHYNCQNKLISYISIVAFGWRIYWYGFVYVCLSVLKFIICLYQTRVGHRYEKINKYYLTMRQIQWTANPTKIIHEYDLHGVSISLYLFHNHLIFILWQQLVEGTEKLYQKLALEMVASCPKYWKSLNFPCWEQ